MNNYLEIRQQLTEAQEKIWQPIEVRKLVIDETEARQILPNLVQVLGLETETYTANLHICRHDDKGQCELIDLLKK